MPELPEVETIRTFLYENILGEKFQQVEINRTNLRFPIPSNIKVDLIGAKVENITRRAKNLIIETNNKNLIMNFGMSGKLLFNTLLPKHNHVIFSFTNSKKITFNDVRRFGSINLIDKASDVFSNIGVEPLSPQFTPHYLHGITYNCKSSIKTVLLNQFLIAGIGNIYASESLYDAKILPTRRAHTISLHECEKLCMSIKSILQTAILAGGCSIKDYNTPTGHLGKFQKELKVYRQENQPCYICQTLIQRFYQQGRSTFFCPTCQK